MKVVSRLHWKDFYNSIKAFWRAFTLIWHSGWVYFYLYSLISLALQLWIGFHLAKYLVVNLAAPLSDWLGIPAPQSNFYWIAEAKRILLTGCQTTDGFILFAGLFYLLLRCRKYLMLFFLNPFLALLSDKTESIITGEGNPYGFRYFWRDLYRGFLLIVRNFFLECTAVIVLWIISYFYPIVGFVAIPVLFLFDSYYYGLMLCDYINERRRVSLHQSIVKMHEWRGLAMGVGSMVALVMYMPVIGAILAPILGSSGVVIALHGAHKLPEESQASEQN